MTISELICRLQVVKCEHGDLDVYVPDEFRGLAYAEHVTIHKAKTAIGYKLEYVLIK